MVRKVLNGPIPTEVDAAIEQEYIVKGSNVLTLTEVWELGTVLWVVRPLPVSVMLIV